MGHLSSRLAVTGAVHVWHGCAPAVLNPADLTVLDENELRRVHSRLASVRSFYAHPHAMLRRILADFYLGGRPEAIRFGRHLCVRCGDQAHGRPRVVAPATCLELSLSRSGPHWAVAITAAETIGLDLEAHRDLDAMALSDIALSERERARIRAVGPGDAERELFLRAWTRKEAVLKAVGVGVAENLRELEVRLGEAGPVRVGHTESAHRTDWCVEDLDLGPGLAAALAREAGHAGPIVLRAVEADGYGALSGRYVT